jgi:hypothetical protein
MPHKAWPWSAGRKCHEMGECGCMVAALWLERVNQTHAVLISYPRCCKKGGGMGRRDIYLITNWYNYCKVIFMSIHTYRLLSRN